MAFGDWSTSWVKENNAAWPEDPRAGLTALLDLPEDAQLRTGFADAANELRPQR